ncbi:MAG: SPOR domain-containing protein [Rhodospirillales bacterium]|nr:SPOR domain-containing protein [Rhodospirillales bacterium]
MRGKTFFVVTCSLLVAGCAAPLPLQVATWALDGLTLMTTGKSVADHGISLVAQKDCALWRGVTDGQICQDYPEEGVAVAKAPSNELTTSQAVNISWNQPRVTNTEVTQLASLAPEAGYSDSSRQALEVLPAPKPKNTRISKLLKSADRVLRETRKPVSKPAHQQYVRSTPLLASKSAKNADVQRKGEMFYVIGSFSLKAYADRLAERHVKLDASIVSSEKNGRSLYRVVIGPFAQYEKKKFRRKILRAGIYDAWVTNIDASSWRFATRPGLTQKEIAQVGPTLQF